MFPESMVQEYFADVSMATAGSMLYISHGFLKPKGSVTGTTGSTWFCDSLMVHLLL